MDHDNVYGRERGWRHWGYVSGFVLGVSGVVLIGGVIVLLQHQQSEAGLRFDPPSFDFLQQPITPGEVMYFDAKLRNDRSVAATVDQVLFSCSCATCEVPKLPLHLSPNEEAVFRIRVAADENRSGPLRLRFGVTGFSNRVPSEAGGIAELRFASEINADPSVITFGAITRELPTVTRHVRLWYPRSLGRPAAFSILSEDPSVKVSVREINGNDELHDWRVDFADGEIVIDTSKAPDRLSANVLITSGKTTIKIPVLAFVGP